MIVCPRTLFRSSQSRLPPEVNRILYVRNLPFKITAEELYAIFGKYGAVYQIRLGDRNKDTKGSAFVVYEDIYHAKAAVDHLSGFNVGGRYLVVLVRLFPWNRRASIYDTYRHPSLTASNSRFPPTVISNNNTEYSQYYQPAKFQRRAETEEKQKELEELRKRIGASKAKMAT